MPTPKSIGPQWLHECKFDGWRMQLHKSGAEVSLYSKKGYNYTKRFRAVAAAAASLPCHSAIIDGELVAEDEHGRPDFAALLERASNRALTYWAFDLMHIDGQDITDLPLDDRRVALVKLMAAAKPPLRLSETFGDPVALLKAVVEFGLEGVVSKRRDLPYRSGPRPSWVKVKTAQLRAANIELRQTVSGSSYSPNAVSPNQPVNELSDSPEQ